MKNEDNLVSAETHVENTADLQPLPSSEPSPAGHDEPCVLEAVVLSPAGHDNALTAGVPNVDAQPKQEVNIDFKKVVNEFVRGALRRGVSCTGIDQLSGEGCEATCTIDSKIKTFSLVLTGGEQIQCDFADMQGIYGYADCANMNPCPVPAISDEWKEWKDRLVVIHSTDISGMERWICILEASSTEKSRFLMCMKCLRDWGVEQRRRLSPFGVVVHQGKPIPDVREVAS